VAAVISHLFEQAWAFSGFDATGADTNSDSSWLAGTGADASSAGRGRGNGIE
jgi:hypothetical protein